MILPIIVLYNDSLAESSTYHSFQAWKRTFNGPEPPIAIYDNSSVQQVNPAEEAHLHYFKHDRDNGGLAAAYNWALQIAARDGFSWLLLLDQDSAFPSNFMRDLQRNVSNLGGSEDVVAIVPRVQSKETYVSPSEVKFGRLAPIPRAFNGVFHKELTAINSGTLVKASFVQSLGGFSEDFRVDCLDHWLFHQIHSRGKRVVVSAAIVKHDLSVLDYRHEVSFERYRSILSSEAAFITTYKCSAEIPVYLLRLLLRSVKQLAVYRRAKIAGFTALTLLRIAANPRGLLNMDHNG